MDKNLAIQITGLGKQYRIGALQARERTLAETLSDSFSRPWRAVRSIVRRENPIHGSKQTIWALKDVTFDVQRGEVVGIIGRNGAGKSTLLKILTRITNPTEGAVRLRGRVGSLLEVGTGFHPELTGRENTYLNGAILGMRREEIDRKFDEIVAFSGVEKFIDTPVKHYSSGMYLRLAFAVAAHLEPDILLVDEVLAVGDAEFQKKCLGKMSDVAGEGRTVLFVSHNMASVKRLCQTAYWLDGGRVREHGPAEELVDEYERTVLEEIGSKWDGQTALVNETYGLEIWNIKPVVVAENASTTLRVEVTGKAARPIERLGVNFQIATIQGTLIFRVGPHIAGTWLHDLHGDWKCVFEFKDISRYLAGGHYAINLFFHTTGHEIILRIDQAALVYLPMVDVYGSGVHFSQSHHGVVPLPLTFHYYKD